MFPRWWREAAAGELRWRHCYLSVVLLRWIWCGMGGLAPQLRLCPDGHVSPVWLAKSGSPQASRCWLAPCCGCAMLEGCVVAA